MQRGKILIDTNDIIGKRLGKLKVVCYVGYKYRMTLGGPRLRHYYLCECECGKTNIVQRCPLLAEIVHSCGCENKNKGKKKI